MYHDATTVNTRYNFSGLKDAFTTAAFLPELWCSLAITLQKHTFGFNLNGPPNCWPQAGTH